MVVACVDHLAVYFCSFINTLLEYYLERGGLGGGRGISMMAVLLIRPATMHLEISAFKDCMQQGSLNHFVVS